MAVSIQTPLYSKIGMWNADNPQTVFSSTESDAVSSSMAYQYSLVSSGMDSPTGLIPSYHTLPGDHSQPNSPALTKPSSPAIRNRGAGSTTKSAKVKRSMSTPNVRGQATADAAALALSAEKRRNKLGYHRTSVACGHCRRRKIRCIPAPADPQNRCSNCIRLKKECNFYPVDQQPQPQPEPSRRGSRARSGTGRASESSSPSTSSGQLLEMQSTLPYPQLNMPSIQDLGGPQMKRQRTESFSPETKVVTSSRNFEYGHGTPNWMAADASPGLKSQSEMSQSFWQRNPQESPLTPAFSPFTPSLQIPPPQNWPPPSHAEPNTRDELSWPGPQRSISYSNLEGLHSHHPYPPYNPHSQQQNHHHSTSDNYTTKPRVTQPGMYPPPITTSAGPHTAAESSSTATRENPQLSHSAGPLPPHYPQWHEPYSYQKPLGAPSEPYSAWNASHGGQHLPDEGHSAPAYGYADPATGPYYPPPPNHGR